MQHFKMMVLKWPQIQSLLIARDDLIEQNRFAASAIALFCQFTCLCL